MNFVFKTPLSVLQRSINLCMLALLLSVCGLPCHAFAASNSASNPASNPTIQVVDDAGFKVTLKAPAARIISLAPNITELLFAAGADAQLTQEMRNNKATVRIVGAVAYSDFPQAALAIASVGDSRDVDIERILTLRPDLVVVWRGGNSAKQIAQIKKLGIPIYYSEPHHLEDIAKAILNFGTLMNTQQTAQQVASQLQQKLAFIRTNYTQKYAQQKPVSVFYQVWDKPLYTLSGQHIVSQAITLCGGSNVFSNLKSIAPIVSQEAVLAANPDAIIGSQESGTEADKEAKKTAEAGINNWRRYTNMNAVKYNNLLLIDGQLMNRAGPRMIDGVLDMCQKLEQARMRLLK